MSWSISSRQRIKAQRLVSERFSRIDMAMIVAELELDDPRLDEGLPDRTWFFELLNHLNKMRQLPTLFGELATKLDQKNPGDEDAMELRTIVESAKPPPKVDTSTETLDRKTSAVDKSPASAMNGGRGAPRPRPLSRIILLGEPTAISAEDVTAARKKLVQQLTAIFQDKNIAVTDWSDGWNSSRGPKVQSDDANSLFIRVVNNDIVIGDSDSLTSLPGKIGRKFGLAEPIAVSQIVTWICDGAVTVQQNRDLSGLALRSDPPEKFAALLKSRFGLGRSPPTISLENPGDNTALVSKLISVVSARTTECQPPDPFLVYMEPMSGERTAQTIDELKRLLDAKASRGGVIIAIHDLNLQMTDDPYTAIWEFTNRLAEYDKMLDPVIKEKGFPSNKIVKIAVIMNLGESLPLGQFPFRHKTKDWVVIGMRREREAAVLTSASDEGIISRHIDELLGQ